MKLQLNSIFLSKRVGLTFLLALFFVLQTMAQSQVVKVDKDGKEVKANDASSNMTEAEKLAETEMMYLMKGQERPNNPQAAKMAKERANLNTDSLHKVYASYKFEYKNTEPIHIQKIIPHTLLPKLVAMDSELANRAIIANKNYSILTIYESEMGEKMTKKLDQIDAMMKGFKFPFAAIVENILPPILITENPISEKEYQQSVEKFMALNPSLIDYCDPSFVITIQKGKYPILIKLQQKYNNTVNIVPQENPQERHQESKG